MSSKGISAANSRDTADPPHDSGSVGVIRVRFFLAIGAFKANF